MLRTLLGNKLDRLQKKSNAAFDVFGKTVTKLDTVNAQIEAEQQKLRDEISKKEDTHASLETQKLMNLKLGDKLKQLLYD